MWQVNLSFIPRKQNLYVYFSIFMSDATFLKVTHKKHSFLWSLLKVSKIRENQISLLKCLKVQKSNIVTERDEMIMEATWLWKHLFVWNLHVIIIFGEYSPTHYFLNRVCSMFLFTRMFFLGDVLVSSKYWRPNWKSHWWYARSNNFFQCECKFLLLNTFWKI